MYFNTVVSTKLLKLWFIHNKLLFLRRVEILCVLLVLNSSRQFLDFFLRFSLVCLLQQAILNKVYLQSNISLLEASILINHSLFRARVFCSKFCLLSFEFYDILRLSYCFNISSWTRIIFNRLIFFACNVHAIYK